MKKFLLYLCVFNLAICCTTQKFTHTIQNGDLIFVEAGSNNLSAAIDRVTKKDNQEYSFDHVALVEKIGKKKYVLHATPKVGSAKFSLKQFIRSNKKEYKTLIAYRINDEFENCIPKALQNANSMLGKPYNDLYILNENSYYCSDYIERAFRNCSIFELQPMTFKNPNTGKIDEYWQQFYQSKNTDVPEGKLGCNPNGISKSKKIHKIATLKL